LRYSRASKETGIGKGEYARVTGINAASNRLTVALPDGTERTYDPRRQQGVSVYREQERAFSTGDRVQLTAPSRELKVANRELGTVESIENGRLRLRMDGGRAIALDPAKHPHLDHGYAVTSHSSQGQTADRVLIHVDSELGAKDLLNNPRPMFPSRAVATTRSSSPMIAINWVRRSAIMFRTRARICQRGITSIPSCRSERLNHGTSQEHDFGISL
jgi:hypothetical protein